MGRLIPLLLSLAVVVAGVAAPAAVLAVDVTWGEPTATATYGKEIVFEQPVTLPGAVRRTEILIETPGSIGPVVIEVEARTGRTTLRHALLVAEGHVLPNTAFTARWRVVGEDGSEAIGPPASVRYEDTRFDWQTRDGNVVRVHWHEGSQAFGERALAIGERAVAEATELLGVTEEEPVDFFVYADEEQFREALGPGTRENVGGQANAEIRTLFALIPPAQIDQAWVGVVIPHELVHLVFDTAVDNPYHFPPRWLNEGLATYLSEGYGDGDRAAVEQAAASGSLIPLEGLTGQFPTTAERFSLAYSESVGAVDHFIRRHGQEALVQLVRSYATGLTDDEAFEQAIGQDVATFDAGWREELEAQDPTPFGPQRAPAGPLPPGWAPADGSPQPGAPSPGTSGGSSSTAPPTPGASSVAGGGTTSGPGWLLPVILGAVGLVVAAVVLAMVLRGRRAAEQAQLRQWAAWREERAPSGQPTSVAGAPSPPPPSFGPAPAGLPPATGGEPFGAPPASAAGGAAGRADEPRSQPDP